MALHLHLLSEDTDAVLSTKTDALNFRAYRATDTGNLYVGNGDGTTSRFVKVWGIYNSRAAAIMDGVPVGGTIEASNANSFGAVAGTHITIR